MRKSGVGAWVVCLASVFSFAASSNAETMYNVAWTRQFGTASTEYSNSVSVDSSGNAYVSGFTGGNLFGPSAGSNDAYLRKYDPSGNVIWSRQFGSASFDGAGSTAIDSTGNIYVGGGTTGNLGGPHVGDNDVWLSKYDSAGSVIWSRHLGTPAEDFLSSVAVDSAGSAFVSGTTNGSLAIPSTGASDAFLAKYDAAGSLLWTRQFGNGDSVEGFGLAVDASGNAYVTGSVYGDLAAPSAGEYDAFLAKYDGAGNLVWTRQIGTPEFDQAFSAAVDPAGNVYISGYTEGSLGGPSAGNHDAFLLKYDSAGNIIWTRQVGTSSIEYGNGLAVDALGNAYLGISGSLIGPGAGSYDTALVKYDSLGNLLWTAQIGSSGQEGTKSVAVDALGNAYVSGYTDGNLASPNAGGSDAFVAKFVPVPEPSAFLLAGTCCVVALGCQARRRRPGDGWHASPRRAA